MFCECTGNPIHRKTIETCRTVLTVLTHKGLHSSIPLLTNTWKAGMSFKGSKIFYCNMEDGQIAIIHFNVLRVKNTGLLYKKSMFVMGSFSIFLH